MALDLIYGLRPLLLTCDALTGIVGTRIQPVLLEQGTATPALTYLEIGGSAQPTFDTSGMLTTRIEFACWGKKFSEADSVRQVLASFLNGYRGVLPDGTYLADAEFLMNTDYFAQDSRLYRCMVEFYLHHT